MLSVRALRWILVLSQVVLFRCAPAVPSKPPLLVLAVDGLEWRFLQRYLNEGLLPNLERLMREGDYGGLETLNPTHSPAIWTTIATGRLPPEHGILTFSYIDATGEPQLYMSGNRRTKAIWNLWSEAGLTVNCVGWWCTFPVEPIRGVMVAQTNTTDQIDVDYGRNVWKGSMQEGVPGQVFPPEQEAEIWQQVDLVREQIDLRLQRTFGEPQSPQSELTRRLCENSRWALTADEIYLQVMDQILEGQPADLNLVYFGSVDVVSHRFMRYAYPEYYEHRPSPEDIQDYGHYIASTYQWVDDALGRLRQRLPEANVLVISDHGFAPINLSKQFDPDRPPQDVNSGGHQGQPPVQGVWIAAGPMFARSARSLPTEWGAVPRSVGGVCDVLPTLLAAYGLPLSEEFLGKPLLDLLQPGVELPAAVDSFEDAEWNEATAQRFALTQTYREWMAGEGNNRDDQRLEQLRALGYLDESGKPIMDPQ